MIGSRRALLRSTRPFLLRDHFGKPAAAGSVNATPAVPGPGGLRTVTDTTNLMQVAPWKGSASLADETTMSATFGAANNRCSYADGQAWVGFAGADFGNAGLTADRWYLLVMQDSSSKLAYCYVKGGDVGAGEALGDEMLPDPGFDDSGAWTQSGGSGWTVAGSKATAVSAPSNNLIYDNAGITTLKKLYRFQVDVESITAGSFFFFIGGFFNDIVSAFGTTGTKTRYYSVGTGANGNAIIIPASTSSAVFDNFSVKEVTTPSAQCIYAYKSVNGSQGWHMDGSFNMNATSYTYDIYELGETALVCAGGKSTVTFGDPGLVYSSVTRRLGLAMMVGPIVITDVTNSLRIGLVDATNKGSNAFRFTPAADTINPMDSTVAGPIIYTLADNTAYYLAIRILLAGCEYYLRTLTGYWKLLWRGGIDTTTPLVPGIYGYDAAFTLSKPGMQLLPAPWNPSCLLYHDFAGDADGAITTSEALDGDGVSAPVRTWLGTTATVSSSKMIVTPSLGGELLTDGGLENWTSATDLTSWAEAIAGTSTVNREDSVVHGGTYACRLDIDASGSYAYINTTGMVSVLANTWYSISCYAKSSTEGKTISIGTFGNTTVPPALTTSYELRLGTFRNLSAQAGFIFNRLAATSSSIYYDDLSVKPITFASTLNLSNLGTSDVLADCYITALTAGTQAGLALCWDSDTNPQNGLLVYYDGAGNIKLDKCVAGTWSNVASTAQAHSADARLRAVKDGTSVTIYHADTLIGSTSTVSDAGIISNTLHGVFSTYEGNTFSKVHIMKRGALNEFRELDNYIH